MYRQFNPAVIDNMEINKLIAYLLKDGPFTKEDGVILNPANLKFKSRADVNRALSAWLDTFIPIIMAAGTSKNPDANIQCCVFGIDPTNRIIWLSDSGIFGSKNINNSLQPNNQNFPASFESEEQRFLNKVNKWITHSVSL
ncbi:MAG: hypothetical protein LIO97_07390, partial [Tannerellaceae bacterium]|nr:hypothetical protein [Tannerellaceae bacterium]